MKESLFSFRIGFALQKDSPYTSKFSTKITQLKEHGLIGHWIEKEQDKVARIVSDGSSTVDFKGLSITNLQVEPQLFRRRLGSIRLQSRANIRDIFQEITRNNFLNTDIELEQSNFP